MRGWSAPVLGVALVVVVACGGDATSTATHAPAPTSTTTHVAPTPTSAAGARWSHADAIGSLRRWLRTCSARAAEVLPFEMKAWPPPEHPDADLSAAEPPALRPGVPWPTGAWLVATPIGRWWVWPDQPPVPLDRAAPTENRC